jgi:hypothetical protein
VVQYSVDVVLDPGFKGNNNMNALCVKLECSDFEKSACIKDGSNCAWNFGQDCSSPHPVWAGSSWNFGMQTTKGQPTISVKSFSTPINGEHLMASGWEQCCLRLRRHFFPTGLADGEHSFSEDTWLRIDPTDSLTVGWALHCITSALLQKGLSARVGSPTLPDCS